MNIVSLRKLKQLQEENPDIKKQLEKWYKVCEENDFPNFSSFRDKFRSVDKVGDYLIFDIKGNDYRLIVRVIFITQTLFIEHLFTHKEYDKWSSKQKE